MVAFHTEIPYLGSGFLISATIPCFFFLSGITFKYGASKLFKSFDKLLVPYITVSVLYNLMNFMLSGETFCFPRSIWFLYVMFETVVIYLLLCKLTEEQWLKDVICIICLIGGLIMNSQYDYSGLKLEYLLSYKYNFEPLKMGSAISMVFFFHLGHRISTVLKKHESISLIYPISFSLLSLILAFFFDYRLLVSVCYNQWYDTEILVVLAVLVVIAAISAVSIVLRNNKVLEFYGRYSLVVLCFHIFVLYFIRTPWAFLIIVVMTWPVVFLINRYVPFLFGLKKSIGEIMYNRIVRFEQNNDRRENTHKINDI